MGMIMKDGVPYGGVYPIDDVPTQGSDNTVKSGGVFSAIEPLPAIQNILGAKNIFTGWDAESNKILIAISDCAPATSYIFSYDEISTMLQYRLYFVNSSGTITEVTNGWTFISNPLSFTTNSDTIQVTFRVKYANDSATISPSDISSTMIRPAGTDPTYASYAKTNKQLTDDINVLPTMQNILGAKNLLNVPDKTMASSGYVFGGVQKLYLPAGSYKFTFNFYGTSSSSQFFIKAANDTTTIWSETFDVKMGANEVSFTLATTGAFAYYYTNAVGDYSKFMIRPAGTDPTYVKHAMTNAELTENLNGVKFKLNISALTFTAGEASIPISDIWSDSRGLIGLLVFNLTNSYFLKVSMNTYRTTVYVEIDDSDPVSSIDLNVSFIGLFHD